MPRYIVLTPMPTRDGVLPPGELVELEAQEADYLLSVNAIAVLAASDAPVAAPLVVAPAPAKPVRAKAKPKSE